MVAVWDDRTGISSGAYLMQVELTQETYASIELAMLAGHLQRKLRIIQRRAEASSSSAQIVQ